MKNEQINLKQWLENYDVGMYESADRNTQIDAGWYDWFCEDSELLGRLNTMAPMVKRLAESAKVNTEKMYVFFKNNCPGEGELYDDFRFCDLVSGDVVFTVTPHSGHTSSFNVSDVWGKENDFEKALAEGDLQSIYNFFGVKYLDIGGELTVSESDSEDDEWDSDDEESEEFEDEDEE